MTDQREFTYLVGVGVTHSIAPVMHDYIASSLGYSWRFLATECPTIDDVMRLFRQPSFAGGVVTMPYKGAVMAYLDGLDEYAKKIGACNNVYRATDGSLRGTNTDWCGVKGCLEGASSGGIGKPAMIIGAGGASRAAVFALFDQLKCNPIYVVNRDEEEVTALLKDTQAYGQDIQIVHIRTVAQAKELQCPYYIVGTVPDFEPQSRTEIEARNILEFYLSSAAEEENKGVLLDMCFKPRLTRTLKMGHKYNWPTVEGTEIIGHQIGEQYRLWCGEDASKKISVDKAWAVLRRAAEQSPAINL